MSHHVIHIFGASGSGTTTLARCIAERWGFVHLDSDDFFWLPTDPPYMHKRPIDERVLLMRAQIERAENAVISGSLTDWGDPLIPSFTLAVRLVDEPLGAALVLADAPEQAPRVKTEVVQVCDYDVLRSRKACYGCGHGADEACSRD